MLVPVEQTPSETGQAVYVWRNIEARLCNRCGSGTAMSIHRGRECVCVCGGGAIGIPHAMSVRHIVICGLLGFTMSHKRHDFQKKATEHKMYFLFSLHLLSATFLILRRIEWGVIKMHIGLHVKSCQILMKLEFSRWMFERHSNVKFRENPSIGSRVVPCGQTETT
jgi:hypothetical protein